MIKNLSALGLGLVFLVSCASESPDIITAAGVVDGDVVTVKSLVAGRIEVLNIREGINVARGDILVKVETDKIENQIQGLDIQEKEIGINRLKLNRRIELLDSNASYWKEQVKSYERLAEKESISGDQLKKARLNLEDVEASLYDARQTQRALSIQLEIIQNKKKQFMLQLEDHVVISPVMGVVLEKFVSENESVLPGVPLADILDLSNLFVEAFLEESELARLKLGQSADILVDGLQDRIFSGAIVYFGRKAEFSPKYIVSEKERTSLLYQVKIRPDKDLEVFKLGMPVTVRIRKEAAGNAS